MQITDNKEHEVRLASQGSSAIAGIPLKKRFSLLAQSPSPSPSQSPKTPATECNQIKLEKQSSPTKDSDQTKLALSVSCSEASTSYLGSQKPITGTASVVASCYQGKEEHSGGRSSSLESSHGSQLHGYRPTIYTASGVDMDTYKMPTLDDIASRKATGKMELKLMTNEKLERPLLEGMTERIPSDKSAFHRVSGNAESLSLKGPFGMQTAVHNNTNFMKQEKLDPSYEGQHVLKGALDVQTAQICAKRSDWDLNTMMDTWGGSMSNEGKDHAESGNLGDGHIIKHETSSPRIIDGERHVACSLSKHTESGKFLKLHSSAMLPTMHLNSDAHIDLHLSPASGPHVHFTQGTNFPPKTKAGGNLSGLSLTANPKSTGNLEMAISKAVKSEPYEISGQKMSTVVDRSNQKIVAPKIVKTEPCEESSRELPELGCNNKSASSFYVKTEPQEVGSQVRLKSVEEKVHRNQSYISYVKAATILGKVVKELENNSHADGMVSQSPLAQNYISCDLQLKMPSGTDQEDVKSRSDVPDSGELGRDLVIATSTGLDVGEIKSTRMTSDKDESFKTTIAAGSELVSSQKDGEVAGKSVLISASMVHGGDVADSFDNSDSRLPEFPSACDMDASGNKEVENEINDEKADMTTESPKEKSKNNGILDHTYDMDGGTQITLKEQRHDDDMEDGEVRDLRQGAGEVVPKDEREAKHAVVEDIADSVAHANVSMETLPHLDEKDNGTQHPEEKQDNHFPESTGNQCSEEIGLHAAENAQTSTIPTSDTIEKSPREINLSTSRDQLSKHKGLEMKKITSKISRGSNNSIETKHGQGQPDSHKVEVDSNLLPENQPSSKSETPLNSNGIKNFGNKTNQSDISQLNSASARTDYVPRKPISSRVEKDNFNGRSFQEDKRRSGSHRDLRGYEKERSQDGPGRKPRYDFTHSHGRFDHKLESLHGNRNSDPNYGSEQLNSPANFRYTRPRIASEASFAAGADFSVEGANRAARKPGNDKLENFSRQPSRRWSPPRRREGHMLVDQQMLHRPMRGISPGRCIDSDIPDLVMLSHEEKFMRDLANDMDPSMLSGSHCNYNRGNYVRRGRRGTSPDQRRGPPHPPRVCSPSSMGPRLRSHMWSPPRRLPDGFVDGHPELIPCRSPQSLRIERVDSPIGGDGFPEDMPDRRHGSPPYVPRLHDGVMREYDYPRPGRGFNRNVRRFHVINSQVNAEEYFDPLHPGELNELVRDDGVDEERNYNGRRGPVRALNQRYNAGDGGDGDRNLSYRIERGPPRPVRFRVDAEEEFIERGNSRDRCIRSRLEDLPHRVRGMEEQEDAYHPDNMQGWHGSGFNDNRLKRRRF